MSVHACESGENTSGFNALKPFRERKRERESAWVMESVCMCFCFCQVSYSWPGEGLNFELNE